MTATFEVVGARAAEARAAMSAYFAELDELFPTGFDSGDALGGEAASFDPPGGRFVVVRDHGETIGCGGVQSIDAKTGEIKRMWIAPDRRGRGLAPQLLAFLEQLSREIGHHTVRLDTNATLTTAITMYERAGYLAIDRYNDNPYAQRWFEKRLT